MPRCLLKINVINRRIHTGFYWGLVVSSVDVIIDFWIGSINY